MVNVNKINAEMRLKIIRFHAEVAAVRWKKRLAEALKVSPASVTNWVDRPSIKARNESLLSIEDKRFLECLGLDVEKYEQSEGRITYMADLIDRFASVSSIEAHALACLNAGIKLKERHQRIAEEMLLTEQRRVADNFSGWRSLESVCCFQSASETEHTLIPLHDRERDQIDELYAILSDGSPDDPFMLIDAKPHSGISFALRQLLPRASLEAAFEGGIYHLHMGAIDEVSELRSILNEQILRSDGMDQKDKIDGPIPERLAMHLHANRQLLIIHGATAANKGARADQQLHTAWRFIEALASALGEIKSTHSNTRVCRLILTCWDSETFAHTNNGKRRSFKYDPAIKHLDAVEYFEEVIDYYSYIRHMHTDNKALRLAVPETAPFPWLNATANPASPRPRRPNNSILKQVRHHYTERSIPHTDFPSAIRFRAFCASDVDSPNPFDPTKGVWSRVPPGLRTGIPEITDCLTDIRSDIRTYRNLSRGDLTTLRLISTGLFYFTENMLEELKNHNQASQAVKDVALTDVGEHRKYIHFGNDERVGRFAAMPLLVRSLIQEDWRDNNDSTRTLRALIHEAIADILLRRADQGNVPDRSQELPYAAPWGENSILHALEAIRHLMRAANSEDGKHAQRLSYRAIEVYDRFLEPGVFKLDESRTVLTTRKRHAPPWRLSRSHGLHPLKYEALCLLSRDGYGNQPPLGLTKSQSVTFFRELGITLTRMLRLIEARQTFKRARSFLDNDHAEEAYLIAHEITAQIYMEDFSGARKQLQIAKSIEGNANVPRDERERMQARSSAREASILFSERKTRQALGIWEQLREEGLRPFSGDRALGYIDTLLATDDMWGREIGEVWRTTELASSRAINKGLEHDRLRLAVRRARIARRMNYPEVAAAMLDQVGIDLDRHGAAEVVFREFQFEAANTLKSVQSPRPRYGFVVYAWPAFEALRDGNATLWITRSKTICHDLLDAIPEALHEELPALDQDPFWEAIESADRRPDHPFYSIDLLPPKKDVLKRFESLADADCREQYRRDLAGY